jgi:hypothetical protein
MLTSPLRKKFLVTKPHTRYVKRLRFSKNCRATEEDEEVYITRGITQYEYHSKEIKDTLRNSLYVKLR